ncbi:MAG: hypothetical protein QG602_4070 [Verrucomicrobiota bacterium]|nr:hypothetical protein [Verrucomicrobiota bacterium]
MSKSLEFHCALVLLAAGASKRMGRPKQLLPVEGQTLLRHVAERVLQAQVSPVVVVLGAEFEQIEPVLSGLPLQTAVNPAWQEGMGSSLRVGVDALLERAPALDALIIALGDQPGLPDGHLDQIIARYRQGGCSLVASHNGQRRVPPVLFGRDWFPRLRTLTGDAGAREILREERPDFASVPLADDTDLDTPEDYARYTT